MENNHGKVGEALYLKYSPQKFFELSNEQYKDGEVIRDRTVPIYIDINTQGNYECVCEYGIEIH